MQTMHLWEAQRMMQACQSSVSLASMFSLRKGENGIWEQGFLAASLSTIKNLDMKHKVYDYLVQLQQSSNHQECQAAILSLKLIMTTNHVSWQVSIPVILDLAACMSIIRQHVCYK